MTERERNRKALDAFRRAARKMKPTKRHRPALWENMLGTVYAQNPEGRVEYFDYDWARAIDFIGPVTDIRVARLSRRFSDDYQAPRLGQLVWFAVTTPITPEEEGEPT